MTRHRVDERVVVELGAETFTVTAPVRCVKGHPYVQSLRMRERHIGQVEAWCAWCNQETAERRQATSKRKLAKKAVYEEGMRVIRKRDGLT